MKFRLPSIRAAVEFRREQHGWTQSKMADCLGIADSHYSEFVHGKRRLPYAACCKAYEIGVPPSVLLQTRKTKLKYEADINKRDPT